MVGNKDRLTRFLENKKTQLAEMEQTDTHVIRYLRLKKWIENGEDIEEEILQEEEVVPELKEPKPRKPRTPKHQAKMPELGQHEPRVGQAEKIMTATTVPPRMSPASPSTYPVQEE